jgi:hypothetical protein
MTSYELVVSVNGFFWYLPDKGALKGDGGGASELGTTFSDSGEASIDRGERSLIVSRLFIRNL